MSNSYKELSNYIHNECGFNRTVIEEMLKGIIKDVVEERLKILTKDIFDKTWFKDYLNKQVTNKVLQEVSNHLYNRNKKVHITMDVQMEPETAK